MNYLKNWLFNFLVVFFVDYVLPGVDVINQTKLPHIGGDLIFAVSLGLLNSLIVPLLRIMDGSSTMIRISAVALILNFAAYALLKMIHLGVFVTSVEGYLSAAFVVSVGSIILNYMHVRHHAKKEANKHEGPQI